MIVSVIDSITHFTSNKYEGNMNDKRKNVKLNLA